MQRSVRALLRVAVVLSFFAAPVFASTDFRILADLDHSAATGCTVDGMDGVDRVIATVVDTSGASPHVVVVTRQDCSGGMLTAPVPVDDTGWPSVIDGTSGVAVVESRVPLAVFGSPLPLMMRLGFVATDGVRSTAIFTDEAGNPIFFPNPPMRRRAVGAGTRTFALEGLTDDWLGVAPIVFGGSAQSNLFRLLGVFAFPQGEFAYFRFDAQSHAAAPTAFNDSFSTPLHTTLTVAAPGVLANDFDPNSRPLTAQQVSAPARGVVVLNADGSLTYVPDDAGPAVETFTYYATNGAQPSNIARVEIHVGRPNHAPDTGDDVYTATQGGTLNEAAPGVLANDSDSDGDPIHAVLASAPTHGTLTLDADGSFVYVNDGLSSADDVFTYFANDGQANSRETTVRIHIAPPTAPPKITTAAKNQTVCAGATATFSAAASGLPKPAVQWFLSIDGGATFAPIAGATSPLYSFSTTAADDGHLFMARFSNPYGSASTSATLTVSTAPTVATAPVSTTVCAGTPATFSVVAAGSASTVQWQVSADGGATFTDIAGATGATYGFTPSPADDAHQFRAVLSNACGTAASAAATLIVHAAPAVTTEPAAQTSCSGATATFAAAATGTPAPAVQWQVSTDGGATFADITGATAATYTFATTAADNAHQFRAMFTNSCGTAASTSAMLTVNVAPAITTPPASQTVIVGQPANFTVTASGVPAPAVQWQISIDGGATFTDISGATANALVFSTTLADSGHQFRAVVTNSCGSATSAAAVLTVACPIVTVTNPATATGTVSAAFNQTFAQAGGQGTVTFSETGALPAGLTFHPATGVLDGTPTQVGTFPITVTATDSFGCSGTGAAYTLVIGCQTIAVTNPSNTAGTVSSAFSEQFTATGTVGTVTFTTASPLPAGLTLATNGVLSGIATQTGTFPITVTATDANGCTGTSATYGLVIACQTITVTNPATTTATVGTAFSQAFVQGGGIGTTTFATASALPSGLTLATGGTLSGTPAQSGTFPIVVTATDANGCTGTSATYNLVVSCQTISVTNPATSTGTVNIAFSQTFGQTGALGGATFSTASTLPAGLNLSTGGVLSGTPTQSGTFPIVVTVTDGNGCTGTAATYNLTIACQTIAVTNPAANTGTANLPFAQTFSAANTVGTTTFTTASALPAGLTLAANGTLAGVPLQTGTFPIVVTATDANGCSGSGATYNLTINCQTITVTNPANSTGTAAASFSETFTAANTIGSVTFTTASTLPAGLTLSTAGVLSGTPTQTGSFPIVVTATDANGCSGNAATYNLTINCQTISVTNPANDTGTVSSPFSEQFAQSGAIGTATFSTASTLPAGLTLSSAGLLSGTPLIVGTFPIVVTVTDSNGCTGTAASYNLTIGCQTIGVVNPTSSSAPAGTALPAANFTFTQSGAVGGATFTTSSTLPTGVSLTAAGVLTGVPTQGGSFPITVTVTDGNGCTGTSAAYTLTITCPVITVTNPATNTGTAGAGVNVQFTQSGGLGTITWSESGALPTGLIFNTATGVLSGLTQQVGSFPITVTATDQNGCQGTGATYTITINCQTITVTNPSVNSGTVDASFGQIFAVTGILGTVTWSETGALPAGVTLDSSTGLLSGTPTISGTFPITVKATDTNGCFGTSSYTLTINCQTITVANPATVSGTVDAAFGVQFTQSGGHGTTTFSTASALPPGLTLTSAGLLAGTPLVSGTFPIAVTATDSNGCTGTGATYVLVINCQPITVTNPANATGTVNVAFSEQFSQTAAHGTATFTTASTLPAGITLSLSGLLSGTTQQHGTFPIVVTVTDSNGCTGTSATYTLVINCQTITVSNPANANGIVAAAFSEQFNQSGGNGTTTFSTASTLPAGLTLSSDGLLSGTPTQSGTFPVTVTATDANGCTGTGATYTLIIACNVISVTNPATTIGTAGTGFSATFTQSGGNGTITWSRTAGALPTGITLDSATGVLSGTTTQVGSFPITVTATDANGCSGSSTYTLTINCQTITISNPSTTSGTAGSSFSATFTASGILGTATWTESGALPTGIVLSSTGVLSGTTTTTGSFPITVKVVDTNGCFATSNYTLTISCQTVTVTNPATTTGFEGNAFSQTFSAGGILGTATWSLTGALPTGLTFNISTGLLSGTPTQTGTFPVVMQVTDTNGCSASGATYNLVIACPTITVNGTVPALPVNTAITPVTFTQTGTSLAITWSATGLPAGLGINSATGVLSGTPSVTGTFTAVVKATDGGGCFGTKTVTIAVAPVANPDTYNGGIDNTQYVVTGGLTTSPTTPFVGVTGKLTANDVPAGGIVVVAGTFATTSGGSVIIQTDGTFIYTPKANSGAAATTSDSFTYQVSSDTGATGTPVLSLPVTVTLNLSGRVWYVKNNGLAGNGQSQSPFSNISSLNAASLANDFLYIYAGDGTTTNLSAGVTLKNGQQLLGQGTSLVVNSTTLMVPGSFPLIGGTINLGTSTNTVTVNGIDMSTSTSTAITATSVASMSVTVRNLTTTTGQAVSIAGTGNTGTMTFTKINAGTGAGGPGQAIAVQNFAGSFNVVGDGTGAANGTGGTIQKTASAAGAISFNNITSTGVSLSSMNITGNTHSAVQGNLVNNFAMLGCSVTSNGALGDDGIKLLDTSGNVTFTNTSVSGSANNNVWITTSSGSSKVITSLTVTNGSYSSAAGDDGFLVSLSGTSAVNTAQFNGVTFNSNFAKGLQLQADDSAVFGNSSGTIPSGAATVSGCSFTGNDVAASFEAGGGTGAPSVYYRFVSNSTVLNSQSHAVNVANGVTTSGGSFKALVSGNVIGNAGTPDSGSAYGNGIQVLTQGRMTGTVTITNNTVRQVPFGRGIDVQGRGSLGGATGSLDITVTGNDVNPQDTSGSPLYAIYVAADDQGSASSVRAAIHDNIVPTISACDTQCAANIGMLWYEAINGGVGTLFKFGTNATVNNELKNTNTGLTGKTCSQNVPPSPAITLTTTPVNTVN